MTLAELNALDQAQFIKELGSIYEHSPWVAKQVYELKPFKSLQQLNEVMFNCVTTSNKETQTQLILNHPELAGKEAQTGDLTQDSAKEQAGAGLDQCSPQELAQLQSLNAVYQETFGFPFIIAVSGLNRYDIMEQIKIRTNNSVEKEFETCIQEIGKIAWIRLQKLIQR